MVDGRLTAREEGAAVTEIRLAMPEGVEAGGTVEGTVVAAATAVVVTDNNNLLVQLLQEMMREQLRGRDLNPRYSNATFCVSDPTFSTARVCCTPSFPSLCAFTCRV